METIEKHEVVHYRGRDVCSCGDFNCASLDARPSQPSRPYLDGYQRVALAALYPSPAWARRVRRMSDEQVFAIYTDQIKNRT